MTDDRRDPLPPEVKPDDLLLSFLLFHDAKRTLGFATDESAAATESLPDDALRGRLDRGRACLELLHRRWPWPGAPAKDDAAAPLADGGAVAGTPQSPVASGRDLSSGPTMLLGRYVLRALIGTGGHGMVFLADDPTLHRKVALKVPRPEWLTSASLRARFLREAQAVARLEHPGIVPIYDFGECGSACYLAAGYVDGPNLADWLEARKELLEPQAAARLVLDLADAVDHAHERGVLHRDLKPSNILLEPGADPETPVIPRITDFGLAKLLDEVGDTTRTGGIRLGTPGYAAPEQSASHRRRVGPPADIYGLGAILHTLLTGQPPDGRSRGASPYEMVGAEPDLPEALWAIVARCLAAEPEDRYSTARALAADLRRSLSGEPVRRYFRIWSRPRRLWRKNRRISLSVAGIVLVLVPVGLWGVLPGKLRRETEIPPAAVLTANSAKLAPPGTDVGVPAYDAGVIGGARGHDSHAAEELRRGTYVGDVRLASRLIRENQDIGQAESILDRWEIASTGRGTSAPDPRRFELGYLRRLAHRETITLRHERGEVYGVRFSADGRWLISAGQDGTARIWNAANGTLRLILRHAGEEVNGADLSPDGRLAATVGDDGALRIWDVATGKPVHEVLNAHGGKQVVCVRFASGPSGAGSAPESGAGNVPTPQAAALVALFSAGRDGRLVSWDITSGRRLAGDDCGVGEIESLDLTDSGGAIVGGVKGARLIAMHLNGSDLLPTLVDGQLLSSDKVFGVAISRDGRWCVTPEREAIRLWGDNQDRFLPSHRSSVYGLAFSRDGSLLATAGERGHPTVRLWDTPSGQPREELLGHTDRIWSVAFAPDGRRLATASRDGTIKLWDPAIRPDRIVAETPWRSAFGHSLTPDGAALLEINHDGRVATFDLAGQAWSTRPFFPGPVAYHAFSPRDRTFAGITQRRTAVVLCDLDGRREPIRVAGRHLSFLAFSPDGRRLGVTDLGAERLVILDPSTGQVLFRVSYQELMTAEEHRVNKLPSILFALSLPGRHPAGYLSFRDRLATWDIDTGLTAHRIVDFSGPLDLLFTSPDGRFAAMRDERAIRVVDMATLKVRSLFLCQGQNVTSVAFSPDGARLASGERGGAVRLWDVTTGEELITLEGHAGPVDFLQFTRDGMRLVSASTRADRVVIWRAR